MQTIILNRLLKGVLVCLFLAAGWTAPAQAHDRVRWRIGIGVPVYGYGWGGWYGGWQPGWYGPAWAYAPPIVMQAPPQRVEVQNLPLGPAPPSYWYYCSNPAGYYPQIATCPGGWAQVLAQPAPAANPPVKH